MAGKLKSVLKTVQLRLILKSLIFAGLLFWVKVSDFGTPPLLLFFLVSFVLYFRNNQQNNLDFLYSFLALLVVSLAGINLLSHPQFLVAAIIFFSFVFYLILGIKGLVFMRRYEWNFAKNIILFFSVFWVYFLSNKADWFFLKFLLVFAAAFLIVREWFSRLEDSFPKRHLLVSLVFSFLTIQLLWAVSILPLGFLNSAALMTVFVYLMFDFCSNHFKGTLNRKLIVKDSIILISAFLIISIFTNWEV